MTAKHTWAVGVGRTLVRGGVPVGRFTRETEPPTLTPSEADDLTRDIVAALNAHDALTAQRDQLLEACKSLALIGEMIGSDWASFVAEVSLPEKERLNRNQFYSRELEKHLDGLGDAVDQAQAAIQAAEGER